MKWFVLLIITLTVYGCDNRSYTSSNNGMSREAYCRSIGLWKEIDSNDCETFADAYDLNEGSDLYKKRKAKYFRDNPQYNKYIRSSSSSSSSIRSSKYDNSKTYKVNSNKSYRPSTSKPYKSSRTTKR